MDDKELAEIVARLDEEISREGATMILEKGYDQGFEETCSVDGNRAGYLRFGIEFLKAALAETNPQSPFDIEMDLNYLLASSEVGFWGFTRRETFEPFVLPEPPKPSLQDRISDAAIVLFCVAFFVLAVIGFVRVWEWVF